MAISKEHGRGDNLRGHGDCLHPTREQFMAALAVRHNQNRANALNHIPEREDDVNRLLALKRDLCCVNGCKHKHIYWTAKGKFCYEHRMEARVAHAAAKREYYHVKNKV